MSEVHVTDVVEVAVGRLPQAFRQLPNWRAFVEASVGYAQELEDLVWALVVERKLDTAIGAQLDQYGHLLNEDRGGLDDTEYRQLLAIKIASNRSNGTAEELIYIVRTLANSLDVRVLDVYPAGIQVSYAVSPPLSVRARGRMRRFVRRSKAAGVRLDSLVEAGVNYFGFFGNPDALGFNQGVFGGLV